MLSTSPPGQSPDRNIRADFHHTSDNEHRNSLLNDLYDAYLIFCESCHTLAWKNLSVILTVYLEPFFSTNENGRLTVKPHSARERYFAGLDIVSLGYLTKDILWVLLRLTGFIADDDEILSSQTRSLAVVRSYLLSLSAPHLQELLAELANELSRRASPSFELRYSCSKSIKDLPLAWSPTSGTEVGILHLVNVKLSPEDASMVTRVKTEQPVALRARKQAKPTKPEKSPRSDALYDLPKRLLRRALSVRTGTASTKKPSRGDARKKNIPSDVDSALAPGAYTRKSHRPDSLKTRITPNLPEIKPSHPKAMTALPSQNNFIFITDDRQQRHIHQLDIIAEEPSEAGETLVADNDDDEQSNWSDSTSTKSAQTVQSMFELAKMDSQLRMISFQRIEHEKRDSSDSTLSRKPLNRVSIESTGKESDQSCPSTHYSFFSARTHVTTKRGSGISIDTFMSFAPSSTLDGNPMIYTAYQQLIREHDLIPGPSLETDWSGRGQHAEFNEDERDVIPLQAEKVLGKTRNALVESVRCRRVRLVRKTMRCSERSGREDALREVHHLYRLQHSHIVRLVGTYIIGTELSIITYPCAEWNLEQFMELTRTTADATVQCASLRQFFTCLAKVLDFMHSYPLKHMDIKPQNLLVRNVIRSSVNDEDPYKIYFTDFGISRSYASVEECMTESPTAYTRMYASHEVVWQESRDLSVDVFSLGCVFAEMIATLLDASPAIPITSASAEDIIATTNWGMLYTTRRNSEGGLRPYYLANEEVRTWLTTLPIQQAELQAIRKWTSNMLQTEAINRPKIRQIADDPHLPFPCQSCTLRTGPEEFEAAEPLSLTPCSESTHMHRLSVEVPKY